MKDASKKSIKSPVDNLAERFTSSLLNTDPTVARIIEKEIQRQNMTLELIASAKFVSKAVLEGTDQQICRGVSWTTVLWRL